MLIPLLALEAAGASVRGLVIDSISREPIPFAAILLEGTSRGVLTDSDGRFQLSAPAAVVGVRASTMGYTTKTVKAANGTRDILIELVPTGLSLNEVTIKPGKEKYSKKNNPALDLMRKIREHRDDNDPRKRNHYNYEKYERITIALDDAASNNALVRKFPELAQHMDTSILSGKPILNLALREKASHINFRLSPKGEKEIVTGLRSEGVDQMTNPQAMQTLYEDVLREVDVYQDDITLMQNRFVSPLSRIAPDFYKFYLGDTIAVGADTCIVIKFAPHNPYGFGFTGHLTVNKNDSTYFVRSLELRAPKAINLNFIKDLRVKQTFERAPDGARLKTLDDMTLQAGILSNDSQLYARRVAAYSDHNFNPAPDQGIFNRLAPVIVTPDASKRDEAFWESRRTIGISRAENSVGRMMTQLRSYKLYYWAEQVVKVIATGYITTGNPSKWDFGPVNTTISYNDLEGVRLRLGGMTTAALSRRLFTRDYVAYGCRDRKWKYMTEWEWSFIDKERHSREFPMHSFRFTHLYDVDMLGQHYLFTNPDNVFLSLKRGKDNLMTYHRETRLDYILELRNNFSLNVQLKHDRQEATDYVRFINGAGERFGHYSMSTAEITLRFAPGEKFFQTRTQRLPVNMDAPIIQLSHRWGPKGFAGNRFALSVTELSFQKRFWMSAFGYLDTMVKGGHVWTSSPFPNLLIPNANLSYTIQPESYALMNPMEFINDSYAALDLTYWANGALFNLIPYFNRLKLREVVAFRGLWGHLSDKNNPEKNHRLFQFPLEGATRPMSNMPYMEISAGLDNIFRILRVDYVWRLSYRDTPDAPRSGLRIALHFSF